MRGFILLNKNIFRLFGLSIICLVLSDSLIAQSNWIWLHPRPQGNYLTKIQYVDENFIVSVGEHGTFMRTTNNGVNWKMDFFEHGKNILDVHFINSTTGFYLDSNRVFKTTNGGNDWIVSLSNYSNRMVDMDFDGSKLRVLHTDSGYSYSSDLGNTWTFRIINNSFYFLSNLQFKGDYGYVLKYNSLLRTSNGGNTWEEILFNQPHLGIKSMEVINKDTLIFYKPSYGIFYSLTRGDTLIYLENLTVGNLHTSSFINNSTGFFGGSYGNFAKLSNFPSQWTDLSLDVNWTIRSVSFLNEQKGAVVGDFGGMAITDNSGLNWIYNFDRFIYDINSIQFLNENIGYLCTGHDSLLKSTNGGYDWFSVLPKEQYNPFGNLYFVNENTGWVCKTYPVKLNKTTNGGLTWIEQNIQNLPTGFYPNKLQFVSESVGFIGGIHSAPVPFYSILKTVNGGNNWEIVSTTRISNFYFINEYTGWIGRGGIQSSELRKTTDGGVSWNLDTIPFGYAFQSIEFVDYLTGYTCGDLGTILKTTDGGFNWTKQHSNISGNFLKITFTDSDNGFIGLNGNILKTNNGGVNWHKIHVPAFNGINKMTFLNENTGWIAGGKSILKTTTGGGTVGIEPSYPHTPSTFSLSQNYPNPFNPSTNIKFEIPFKDQVKLAVYNLLGQEIQVLVNSQLNAGSYQYTFDASSLTSGVYFYKLTAGSDFSQTKKMVLIR